MSRYADVELLKADIRPFAEYESNLNNKDWVRRVEVVIDNQPTADVVEVVRCMDCKRHIENDAGDIFCNYHGVSMLEDDYCSYGERRTDG